MTLAVHIRFSDINTDPSINFNFRCFTILAGKYPDHHFIFLFDKPFNPSLIMYKNIKAVLVSPQIKNRLLAHYWYHFKIPALLVKNNVTHFIGNAVMLSLRTNVYQCLVLPDLSFFQKINLYPKNENRYIRKYLKKFIVKANSIVVPNKNMGGCLTEKIPEAKGKIRFSGYGINNLPEEKTTAELQHFKDTHTDGKDYFLCFITDSSVSNTIPILKAFSAFKKRLKSNLLLVLVLSSKEKENPVKEFATYKYREEVKIISADHKDNARQFIAASYAAIFMNNMEVLEYCSFSALENSVPLITTDCAFNKTIFLDAAIYVTADENNISEKMMILYKDEYLRKQQIIKGRTWVSGHSWERCADNLWESLTNTGEL